MPRFFFDIHDGEFHTRDEEGGEFANREDARAEALEVLPNLAREVSPDGNRRDFVIDVRDETRKLIFTATLSLVARWVE